VLSDALLDALLEDLLEALLEAFLLEPALLDSLFLFAAFWL
jgi:hypothetical protein